MTDQSSVFSEQQPTKAPEATPTQSAPNPYEDLLKGIKNEAGVQKYATIDDALKALQHAQTYIPEVKSQLTQREQELAEARAKLEQQAALEEVVSRLAKPNQPDATVDQPRASGLDESAVMRLVQQQLAASQAQQSAQQNQQQVEAALKAQYGDKTADVVRQRAAELGLTPQALGELSSKSPQAVLALFNTKGTTGPKPTTSSVNIAPSYSPERAPLERPTKSLLTGASSKDQAEFMAKIRAEVYAKNGINS